MKARAIAGLWGATCLLAGCAVRHDRDAGHDADEVPSQVDDDSPRPVVVGSGGTTDLSMLPEAEEERGTCDVTPRIGLTSSEGTIVFDVAWLPDGSAIDSSPLELNVFSCAGGYSAGLSAGQSMLGAENLGGSPGSAEGAAKLSLWFHDEDVLLDVHHGGLTLTYGTGEYISTEGEKFALVLDENLPGDFLSDEALLVERTLRYLGTNTEGQTSEFHVALSLCRSMSMCLL